MEIFNFAVHIDQYISNILSLFGLWSYVILALIIFAETGLVIAPFLPGDSLLFVIGTFAGGGYLDIWLIYTVLLLAAIGGDSVNYWLGNYFGPKVFTKENSRFFNKVYLEKTRKFYEKYGGRTVIIARFLPILRTFAPFVAGIGQMRYKIFFLYNVVGAFLWITSFLFIGYFFGALPFVQKNFKYIIVLIILLSVAPIIVEYFKYKRDSKMNNQQLKHTNYQDIQKTFQKEHLND